jgi:hypothetical protein
LAALWESLWIVSIEIPIFRPIDCPGNTGSTLTWRASSSMWARLEARRDLDGISDMTRLTLNFLVD